jgi:hypothetical protein
LTSQLIALLLAELAQALAVGNAVLAAAITAILALLGVVV